jgi:hypothetical protein
MICRHCNNGDNLTTRNQDNKRKTHDTEKPMAETQKKSKTFKKKISTGTCQ